MLNCSASLAMSTSVLKALPGKLDIKRHSPSILYLFDHINVFVLRSQLYFFFLTTASGGNVPNCINNNLACTNVLSHYITGVKMISQQY